MLLFVLTVVGTFVLVEALGVAVPMLKERARPVRDPSGDERSVIASPRVRRR